MSRWMAGAVLALAAGLAPGWPAEADSPEDLVKTIRAVGPEGKGNEKAAAAWKALASAGPEALMPILKAVNDDELRAANWLRSAFEAAAGKALDAGKLPKDKLEAFIKDTRNAPLARRLAYEWVVRADPTTPERLLPGMLLDPSPDLRRDAVERLVKAGDAFKKAGNEAKAKAAYREALASACDPDQVDGLAESLEKLGEKVDIQKHFGFVSRWHVAAPFEHAGDKGWDVAYPPEKGIDLKEAYKGKGGADVKWKAAATEDKHGLVDINKVLDAQPPKNIKGAVAYAIASVVSPKGQDVWLRMGCINGLKVFVNGKPVFARPEYHHGQQVDQYAAKARFKAGRNEILLKVCQNEQAEDWAQSWQFQLRLSDFTGSAVAFTQPEGAKGGKE